MVRPVPSKTTMPTHYERLGVRPDDDRETIWRAYLGAVRTALVSNEPAAEIRSLDEAWAVLRDPESRAAYDRTVDPPRGDGATHPAGGPVDVGHAEASGEPAAGHAPSSAGVPALPAPPGTRSRGSARQPAEAEEPPAAAPQQPAADEEPSTTRGRRRPGRSRPTAAERPPRRRGATVLAWLLACALGGIAFGLAVYLTGERTEAFVEGSCVALAPAEASQVPCGSARAEGRITAVVTEPQACGDVDGGWVERPDGRLACIELIDDADSQ